MRNDRNRWLGPALLAMGLLCAATAQAQTANPSTAADQARPPAPGTSVAPAAAAPVPGVTVTGRRPDRGPPVPADKKAEYDAEVAREEAFRAYRQSTPKEATDNHGIGDPNDLSKDFPGLQSYIPKPTPTPVEP